MQWTPNASYALVQALNYLTTRDPPILFTGRISKQFCLLQHLLQVEITDAYRFARVIDVVSANDGVSGGPWGDMDFD